jgi:hypothetical protein
MPVRHRRKRRRGELTCVCQAYDFPHRFSGGACTGRSIVVDQWGHGGWNRECARCHCKDKEEIACQVLEGKESVSECPAWQSFIAKNEIRVSLSRLRELARSARHHVRDRGGKA